MAEVKKRAEFLQKYDTALLGILQNEGDLEPFLDILFGFLFRKTDFYCSMENPKQKYGFPPGVAEKLITSYFHKYKLLTEKMEKQAKVNEMKWSNEKKDDTPVTSVEPTKQTENVKSETTSKEPKQVAVKQKNKPVLKEQKEFQCNPDSYNGAVRENYLWSQNYDDVDVVVPVKKAVVKSNMVKVRIDKKRLFVSVMDENDKEFKTVVDDELKHEILKEESMWSLEAGKNIQITLAKHLKFWWNSLLVAEEEIDVKKISPERSMATMDEDDVAVINKLQFDEHQKRLGLPQSHELKVHEMLKKGWNAEGSPFKGQEFDPKAFSVSPSAVQ